MSNPDSRTLTRSHPVLDVPWNVLVHDDPVNLMDYVTWVLMRLFHYKKPQAAKLMMEIHTRGKAVVWSGPREQAELYLQELHANQLRATIQPASP